MLICNITDKLLKQKLLFALCMATLFISASSCAKNGGSGGGRKSADNSETVASPNPNKYRSFKTFTLVSGAGVGAYDNKPYFTAGHGNHGFFGYVGVIDGQANPTIKVRQGDTVKILLLDHDQRGQPGRLAIPELHLCTTVLTKNGQSASLIFVAGKPGIFEYTGAGAFGSGHNHKHMTGSIWSIHNEGALAVSHQDCMIQNDIEKQNIG